MRFIVCLSILDWYEKFEKLYFLYNFCAKGVKPLNSKVGVTDIK